MPLCNMKGGLEMVWQQFIVSVCQLLPGTRWSSWYTRWWPARLPNHTLSFCVPLYNIALVYLQVMSLTWRGQVDQQVMCLFIDKIMLCLMVGPGGGCPSDSAVRSSRSSLCLEGNVQALIMSCMNVKISLQLGM